jgi:hypothetical protein
MKMCGAVTIFFHSFLTSALDGAEWPASFPGSFTPRKEALIFTG